MDDNRTKGEGQEHQPKEKPMAEGQQQIPGDDAEKGRDEQQPIGDEQREAKPSASHGEKGDEYPD